eukprot:Plantae.Rhodophyta-Palmaria_palmata.ctg3713.p1 GENE.Plantae.Rhodophyta-Palmaria_palmata.ctg3713~~Plantae.Rhodophyta-Palmaria_palmata.ctg3713.p1  ORF type:complete len:276 (-),score=19.54 Plantae.Rhodophyta-Palmaria_palmata.ctg3713:1418-2245(-)
MPTFKPLTKSVRQLYDENGFVIVRNAIDPALAAESVKHVHWLLERNEKVRPEQLHHGLLSHDPFIHRLAGDENLLDIVAEFIGPSIALFAAHYIAKRPLTGQAVAWHQDGSYWPLEPMDVTSVWLCGSTSRRENGCMRVLPGTQDARLLPQEDMIAVDTDKYVLNRGIHPSQIDESQAVDLELEPGDISIHNPRIVHGSNANTSESWRVGLTLRYIPPTTCVKNADHESVLFRGAASVVGPAASNLYTQRPIFNPKTHMAFRGCHAWNDSTRAQF